MVASSASASPPAAGRTADGAANPTIRIVVRKADTESPAAAQRLFDRIDEAAMEVCGASPFSFAEVRRAVRQSDCWRQSVSTAVAKVQDPSLTARLEQRLDLDRGALSRQD
jgi:UrcA family protein